MNSNDDQSQRSTSQNSADGRKTVPPESSPDDQTLDLSPSHQAGSHPPKGASTVDSGKGGSTEMKTKDMGGTKVEDTQVGTDWKPGTTPSDAPKISTSSAMIIGDYVVLEEIGRGGMGVVYKAKHLKLNRVVALKMILTGKHSTSDSMKRFIAEARAVAKLQHPGIVQIFDIGEHNGVPYFSLEYVNGRDLHRQLNGQPQAPNVAAELVEQLSLTMQYAHEHGILHRDLKPANVLMDENGRPKIADFGLAKEVDDGTATATSQGTIMGSPSYMPPEQARGEVSSITPRSDLYSLGAILYQLLTGRPPFISSRPVETVLQVVNNDPVQPRTLQPNLPIDIETICMKALQKDQATRYSSCQELAADLRRFINGEPIIARPVSRIERTWRWCKRNPRVAVPSALAGMLIVLTSVVSTWAWITTSAQAAVIVEERDTAKREKDEADRQREIANGERERANVNAEKATKEKEEAERQRVIADQQKKIAEENEELARKQAELALENIKFVVTEIDETLKKQPGTNDLRIQILEVVSKRWNELDLKLVGGIRGEAIPTFMRVRQLIAIALTELGRLESADKEYEQLYKSALERIELKGRTDATRTNVAKVILTWYPVRARLAGDQNGTIELLKKAIEYTSETLRLPANEPNGPPASQTKELLSLLQQNLGVEFMKRGNLVEARDVIEKGLETQISIIENLDKDPLFQKLTDQQKVDGRLGRLVSRGKAAMAAANCTMRLGETDNANEKYKSIIATYRELLGQHTDRQAAILRTELAGTLDVYGNSMLWMNQLDLADAALRESVQFFRDVYQIDPEKADAKRQLTLALYHLGWVREFQGQRPEALALFEESRLRREELVKVSDNENNRSNLMLAEAAVGNRDKAKALSDRLGETKLPNANLHFERARALATLSTRVAAEEKDKMRDEALTALERSVTDGFSDPFRIEHDVELRSLNDSERLRKLVTQLKEAKKAPEQK